MKKDFNQVIRLDRKEDKKVKDHGNITEKYRGAAHSNCNFKLSKNVRAIFHNLISYVGYLFMQEISKFDVEISIIPNGLEKYMTLLLIKFCFLLAACNLRILA